jgi:hypothetical protein
VVKNISGFDVPNGALIRQVKHSFNENSNKVKTTAHFVCSGRLPSLARRFSGVILRKMVTFPLYGLTGWEKPGLLR